jgi:hypothetical protein
MAVGAESLGDLQPDGHLLALPLLAMPSKCNQIVRERNIMRMSHTPPPVLDHGRVLEYAVLNDRVEYSGHSLPFVDGKEVGPVPRLAICQSLNNPDIVLLHCDDDWNVLGAGIFNSAGEAKSRAEKTYPGVATCWIKSHFTNP